MRFFLLTGLFFLALSIPLKVQANVFFTEVYPTPSSGEQEWFELYNDSASPVTLTNWTVSDKLSAPSLVYAFAETDILAPYSYTTFFLPNQKLNNAADGLTLTDACQTTVDTMDYSGSITADFSWSLNKANWEKQLPSPGQQNPTPLPSVSPSPTISPSPTPSSTPTPSPSPNTSSSSEQIKAHIKLSEVMACPLTGDKEWIELSSSSSENLALVGWKLLDSSSTIYTFSSYSFPAHSLEVIELPSARLNNSGDSLSLVSPDGEIVWHYTLPACVPGTTHSLVDNEFLVTPPSKGQINHDPATENETAHTITSSTPSASTAATITSPSPSLSPISPLPYPGTMPTLQPQVLGAASENASPSTPAPDLFWPLISVILGGGLIFLPSSIYLAHYVQKNLTVLSSTF